MTSRVLVVDDEPAIRHAVGRLLRREGWDPVTVATGMVFVSGDPTLSVEDFPAACRGARLLPKPFDLLELAAVLRGVLAAAANTSNSSGNSA